MYTLVGTLYFSSMQYEILEKAYSNIEAKHMGYIKSFIFYKILVCILLFFLHT